MKTAQGVLSVAHVFNTQSCTIRNEKSANYETHLKRNFQKSGEFFRFSVLRKPSRLKMRSTRLEFTINLCSIHTDFTSSAHLLQQQIEAGTFSKGLRSSTNKLTKQESELGPRTLARKLQKQKSFATRRKFILLLPIK